MTPSNASFAIAATASTLLAKASSTTNCSITAAKVSVAARYSATCCWRSGVVVVSSRIGGTVNISIAALIPKPKKAFACSWAWSKLAKTSSATLLPFIAISTASDVNGVAYIRLSSNNCNMVFTSRTTGASPVVKSIVVELAVTITK